MKMLESVMLKFLLALIMQLSHSVKQQLRIMLLTDRSYYLILTNLHIQFQD
ncbi:MAG TPA: hypothetical protein DCW44_01995 [Eubacterium sp.]|nr:hypothetical protein [Eubacterium sp.]